MTWKILSLITITVSIFVFQSAPPAQSSPIFGPKKYAVEKWKPEKTIEKFYTCTRTGVYKLTVDNSINTEMAGEIRINGEEIMKRLVRAEKAISLKNGENKIEVKVKGKTGEYITVAIECISECLEPKITFPSSDITVNNSEVVILGNISNLHGKAGITIQSSNANGQLSISAQVQGMNFASVIPIHKGQNTITVIATDACGYKATDTITISTEEIQEPTRLTANIRGGTRK